MPSDSVFYRVEAHDGKGWTFGIRLDENFSTPKFCSLKMADIGCLEDAKTLMDQALALCGGTLRIAPVPLD
jgi:hypothetical protein